MYSVDTTKERAEVHEWLGEKDPEILTPGQMVAAILLDPNKDYEEAFWSCRHDSYADGVRKVVYATFRRAYAKGEYKSCFDMFLEQLLRAQGCLCSPRTFVAAILGFLDAAAVPELQLEFARPTGKLLERLGRERTPALNSGTAWYRWPEWPLDSLEAPKIDGAIKKWVRCGNAPAQEKIRKIVEDISFADVPPPNKETIGYVVREALSFAINR